jgi:hypothetical protein
MRLTKNCSPKTAESMTNLEILTPEELVPVATVPQAALLPFSSDGGCGIANQRDRSAPKKRRKMSAAWRTMIAVTENRGEFALGRI